MSRGTVDVGYPHSFRPGDGAACSDPGEQDQPADWLTRLCSGSEQLTAQKQDRSGQLSGRGGDFGTIVLIGRRLDAVELE